MRYQPKHPLDVEGDRLLREAFAGTDGYALGGVSTSNLNRKDGKVFSFPHFALLGNSVSAPELARTEALAILDEAGLTSRQFSVVARRVDGWTFEQIAEADKTSKQGACNIAKQAQVKLARAMRRQGLVGLRAAFLEDSSRGLGFRQVLQRSRVAA